MTMPVRPGSRRSCRSSAWAAGIVAAASLFMASSPVAAPTDVHTDPLMRPRPVERFLVPFLALPDHLIARRGGTALTPVAVLPAAYARPHRMIRSPLPVEPSWDLEEPDRLEAYQDILGFGGLGTPVSDVYPQIAYAARDPAHTSTVVLADVILKMTAIVFLAILIMIPAGCAILAKTLYVNPRDGPQWLDVRAGPTAAVMAYPWPLSCH